MVLHWVVQRNAQTGVLITFKSFENYADAERHKAKLEAIAHPLGHTNVVAIESLLPSANCQEPRTSGTASASQPDKPLGLSGEACCCRPFHDLAHSKSRAIREKPDFLKYRETASFLARAQRNPSGLKSNNPTAIASELVEVVAERQGGLS